MLLLERPKRAINPQIQRRARALSSLRKAWDVSAGRTNRTASPAEVASSAKLFCSSGYYTQILSICRPGCCSGLCRQPPRLPAAPPAPPEQPQPRCHPPKPRAPEAPARVAPFRGGWPRAARPLQARWGRGWIPGGAPRPPPRVRLRYYSEARQRNPEHPEHPLHAQHPCAQQEPTAVPTRAARGRGHRGLASPLPPSCVRRVRCCSRPKASAGRKMRPHSELC